MSTHKPYLEEAVTSYHDRHGDQIAEWKQEGFWPEETFPEQARETIENHPAKRVVGPNRTETFDDVQAEATQLAAGLQQLGFGTGSVISYALPNWVSTPIVHLAISMIGAVANPIVPIYRHREFKYILNDVESDAIFIPDIYREFDYAEMMAEIQDEIPTTETIIVGDPDTDHRTYSDLLAMDGSFTRPTISPNDPHMILHTSGTTSDPKGVIHTHNTVGACEVPMIDRMNYSTDDSVFVPTPVTHISGVVRGLRLPFIVGTDVVFMDKWDPEAAVDLVSREQTTRLGAATPFVQGLLEQAPDGWDSPFYAVGCGGSNVSPELIKEVADVFDCWAYRGWGMTEYPGATKSFVGGDQGRAAETDGRLLEGTTIKIVDIDSREELETGEDGEILVAGPQVMVGYIGEHLNEEAFEGTWFKTGDVGHMSDDGYLTITGRTKDVIIRGGENIPVNDVEDKLNKHPAVEDVAIVAMPDPDLQEKGCAYVTVADGESFTFEEMTAHLDAQNIAKQKYPERLEITDEFSRTASGKIQKEELRTEIAKILGMEPVER